MTRRATAAESAAAWHAVAAAVLRGEHAGAKGSAAEALVIGLRCYPDDAECAAALKKVDPQGKFKPKEESDTER